MGAWSARNRPVGVSPLKIQRACWCALTSNCPMAGPLGPCCMRNWPVATSRLQMPRLGVPVSGVLNPTMDGCIQHSPLPKVLNMAPGHYVVMKAFQSLLPAILTSRKYICFRVSRSLYNTKNSGAFGIFEPHMHPGNYFGDIRKIADGKLWSVSFYNHVVARCHVENCWRDAGLNAVRAMFITDGVRLV